MLTVANGTIGSGGGEGGGGGIAASTPRPFRSEAALLSKGGVGAGVLASNATVAATVAAEPTGQLEVCAVSDALVAFAFFEAVGVRGRFAENLLFLLPAERRCIGFVPWGAAPLAPERLAEALELRAANEGVRLRASTRASMGLMAQNAIS